MQLSSDVVTCKNCGNIFSGKYCNHCGEKVYGAHDKSIAHFFEDAMHFISHFEGTLLVTIKTLFRWPGKLSLEYCDGIRKKYFRPLQFFLLLVVLYLLFPLFQGLNMRLQYYRQMALVGKFAAGEIEQLMHARNISFDQLEELFRHKSEKIAKILLIVLIPLSAFFLWAFTFRRKKYFFDQLVFSTELNCMYILWGFLLLPLLLSLFEFVFHYFSGNYVEIYDSITGFMVYIPLFLYVVLAARRFYDLSYFKAILIGLLFLIFHPYIVLWFYKFILFIITIYFI